MPFPQTPREIYRNNPLDVVTFQLRFPTILSITAGPPVKFQEAIRSEYPWYTQQSQPDIPGVPPELTEMAQGFGMPQVPPTYLFETENRMRRISLAQDSLSVNERDYQQWGDFRSKIERAEGILNDLYAPAFYTRIGLRYQDVLDRSRYGLDATPWSELLNPIFLGILGSQEIGPDVVRQSQSQVALTIPDVDGGQVVLQHGLVAREGADSSLYLIDADFSTQSRCNSDDAFDAADKFNRWAGHLFRWATTDALREQLNPHGVG